MELRKELTREQEEEKKASQKKRYDKKARQRSFQPGDLVLLRTPVLGPKLLEQWDGPYSVITKIDELMYELSMPDHPRRRIKRHINLLKEFNSPTAACLALSELTGDDLTEKPEDGGKGQIDHKPKRFS